MYPTGGSYQKIGELLHRKPTNHGRSSSTFKPLYINFLSHLYKHCMKIMLNRCNKESLKSDNQWSSNMNIQAAVASSSVSVLSSASRFCRYFISFLESLTKAFVPGRGKSELVRGIRTFLILRSAGLLDNESSFFRWDCWLTIRPLLHGAKLKHEDVRSLRNVNTELATGRTLESAVFSMSPLLSLKHKNDEEETEERKLSSNTNRVSPHSFQDGRIEKKQT